MRGRTFEHDVLDREIDLLDVAIGALGHRGGDVGAHAEGRLAVRRPLGQLGAQTGRPLVGDHQRVIAPAVEAFAALHDDVVNVVDPDQIVASVAPCEVDAIAAVDPVVAVPTNHGVVAVAAGDRVIAGAAVDRIVPGAAVDQIIAAAAQNGVVAAAAQHRVVAAVAVERVVPAATVDEVVAGATVEDVAALRADHDVIAGRAGAYIADRIETKWIGFHRFANGLTTGPFGPPPIVTSPNLMIVSPATLGASEACSPPSATGAAAAGPASPDKS